MELERIEELRKKGFSYREILGQSQRLEEERRIESMEKRISEIEEFREKLEGEIEKIGGRIIKQCGWVVNGYCTFWGWNKNPGIKGVKKIGRRWHKKADPFRCVFCYRVV